MNLSRFAAVASPALTAALLAAATSPASAPADRLDPPSLNPQPEPPG